MPYFYNFNLKDLLSGDSEDYSFDENPYGLKENESIVEIHGRKFIAEEAQFEDETKILTNDNC